jgi:transcriptional regulator with XRE-family HTH domain
MSFRYNKLRGKIVEVFGSQAKFAEEIGQSEQNITAKLAGRSSFTQDNIVTWCQALNIDQADIGSYFFTREVSKG